MISKAPEEAKGERATEQISVDDAVEVVLSEVVGIFTPKEEQKTAKKDFLVGNGVFVLTRFGW